MSWALLPRSWVRDRGWTIGTLSDAIRAEMLEAQAEIDASRAMKNDANPRGSSVLIEEVSMTIGVVLRKGHPFAADDPGTSSLPIVSTVRRGCRRFLDRVFGRVMQPVSIAVRRADSGS